MKLLVFGGYGMLGKAVTNEARTRGYNAYPVRHSDCDIAEPSEVRAMIEDTLYLPPFDDMLVLAVNCAGAIPPHSDADMIRANALGPHVLVDACKREGVDLVHVSTDCVFSGAPPPSPRVWHEVDSQTNAFDTYGRTKALGELIADRATVVRTSFIGPDHGLLRWMLDNREPAVDGWLMAHWNGSSVFEVARGILDLIEDGLNPGIEHLSTPRVFEKSRVLASIKRAFDLETKINLTVAPVIYRALKPTLELRDLDDPEVMEELVDACRSRTP